MFFSLNELGLYIQCRDKQEVDISEIGISGLDCTVFLYSPFPDNYSVL